LEKLKRKYVYCEVGSKAGGIFSIPVITGIFGILEYWYTNIPQFDINTFVIENTVCTI